MADKYSYVMYRHSSGHRWIGLFVGLALLCAQSKFRGGSYDGGGWVQVFCPPVVLISVKFQGRPYDGESTASLTCPPIILISNKFQGGPYDGESMASLTCPPIIFTSNKFQGGPYDGESMASLTCPPILLTSNKFQGGPYDGESMGMFSNPCGPPLGISGEVVLMGRWLQPGEALLTWSFSQDPEVMLYALFRQAAGSSVWATVETTLPIEAPDHPYEVIDRGLAPGNYLYRVEVVMKNGSIRYSNAVELGYVESPEPEIVAYPNPTRDAFHLRVYLPYESEVVIEGWDMTGRRVMMKEYFHRKGQALYTVSMQGFAQGLYSFRLQALSVGESWNFHVLKVD